MASPFPFVAGNVLQAAQLNAISELPTRTLTGSGAAVAADSYSRVILNGSSITYTINTSTFTAGQVVELYNANSTAATIAAGAGVTLNGAASLTLAQYQSAQLYAVSATSFVLWKSDVTVSAGGLTYITGAAFSAVSSVSAPNSTFTSTYTNYLLLIDVSAASAQNQTLLRWRASGTDTSSANYYTQSNDSAAGTASQINVAAGTSHRIATLNPSGTYAQGIAMTIFAPQLARATVHVGQSYDGGEAKVSNFGGTINLTTQYDAFTLLTNTGTITGNYRVYGYQNS